ncbi:MAG: dockerin type I repeat-containing protein [Clostridia bacterium]|nr:dockerin type I repeat-containing protein [Clostridia bacterium]
MNKRKSLFCGFVCLLLVFCSLPVAKAAEVPAITWAYTEEKSDHAVLHFETPAQYLGQIDAYELRTDYVDWIRVADGAGGKMQIPDGGNVYLRCTFEGWYSAVWSTRVEFGSAYILTDSVSGAGIAYRASDNFPANAYLSADRITSGKVFEDVQQAVQTSKHFELYDIYFLYADGHTFDPADSAIIRLPLGTQLKREKCKVYYVDEIGKRLLELPANYDRTCISFRSKGPGLYFVTDESKGEDAAPTPSAPAMGSALNFYGARLLMGDIDGDSAVTANDARSVLRASVGLETLNVLQAECADTDWNGKITAGDARTVLRYSVGL